MIIQGKLLSKRSPTQMHHLPSPIDIDLQHICLKLPIEDQLHFLGAQAMQGASNYLFLQEDKEKSDD